MRNELGDKFRSQRLSLKTFKLPESNFLGHVAQVEIRQYYQVSDFSLIDVSTLNKKFEVYLEKKELHDLNLGDADRRNQRG